jgi:hypothetical protein
MVEKTRRLVKLLAVPLHGRLPRAGGFPATGELVARTDAHEERTSAAFEWAPGSVEGGENDSEASRKF